MVGGNVVYAAAPFASLAPKDATARDQ
jgi:hypothetical protein